MYEFQIDENNDENNIRKRDLPLVYSISFGYMSLVYYVRSYNKALVLHPYYFFFLSHILKPVVYLP